MRTTMRYEKGSEIGDLGVTYDFDIRLPVFRGIQISDANFGREAQESLQYVKRRIKRAFPWVGRIEQTGRSGGWLSVEDPKGKANKTKLQHIAKIVDEERDMFMRMLKKNYTA